MRKQITYLIVFVVLALGVSLAVFFADRSKTERPPLLRDQAQQKLRQEQWERTVQAHQRMVEKAATPRNSPAGPSDDVQRNLDTIKDIQRINSLNAENQKRRTQPVPPRPPSKKK